MIRRNHNLLLFCALAHVLVTAALPNSAIAEESAPPTAWDQRGCTNDARGEWFREAKFGAFIHFGIFSELGGYYKGQGPYVPAEQIMGLGDRYAKIPPAQFQKDVGGAFNPSKFDARQWVSLIKKAGQKYLIVTTKHHDGFCMFRTATTGYNVVDSTPFKRDIIKELADECARQGIVFCPYYSIGDWSAADVMKPEFKNYKEYMFAQLKELLTNYGDIRMLWFDNYWYVKDQWKNDATHAKELYNYVRSINPNVLVNDRCGRGVQADDGDYATPENQLRGSLQSRYFEVVMTDTDDENWGWVRGATNYRKPAVLIRNLIDCTSKGGNFVLNVGPMSNGEFPPEHVAIIEAMGKWTAANGEAIYGALPAPECVPQAVDGFVGYTTRKNNSVFLHVVQWPSNGSDIRVEIKRTGLAKVDLLDPSLPAVESTSRVEGASTWVTLKKPAKTDPSATVVRLAFN